MRMGIVILLAGVSLGAAPVPLPEGVSPVATLQDRHFRPTNAESAAFLRQQAAFLKSGQVLEAVLRRPEVAHLRVLKQQSDPFRWLETNLQVEPGEAGELQVWLRGGSRAEQVELINLVVETYLQEAIRQQRRPVEKELAKAITKWNEKMEEMAAIRQELGRRDPNLTPAQQEKVWEVRESRMRAMRAQLRASDLTMEELRRDLMVPFRISVLRRAR